MANRNGKKQAGQEQNFKATLAECERLEKELAEARITESKLTAQVLELTRERDELKKLTERLAPPIDPPMVEAPAA